MSKWLSFIILFGSTAGVFAQTARQLARKGNSFYEEQKFTEAQIAFGKSMEASEEGFFEGQFNLADALIKQKKYDEALKHLGDLTASTEDKEQLSKVYHNMGNALLENKKLEESIAAYKNALRNNPSDDETRYNLAYAQNLLKKQEQQQQDQDQNKDQQDQDKKDKEDQEKQDQQNQDQQKDQEDKQDQQQQNQDQKKDQQKQDQQQQQANPNELSKEAAEQILQALQQDEKEVQEKVQEQKMKKVKGKRVEKEW